MKALTTGSSVLFILVAIAAGGCRDGRDGEATADIAVTNSYLQCAVQDLGGDSLKVMCLAPPGMCPGHFDISPVQVRTLRDCRMLLLFDFQHKIETSLRRLKDNGLKTCLVTGPSGLCVPDAYLTVCREVSKLLMSEYPERERQMAERLSLIEERMSNLSRQLQTAVRESPAASAQVLVSNHQVEFARWLGLEPVATFVGSDIETVSNIDHCLQQAAGHDVRYVIANLQEGTSLAQALAERIGAKAVVFGNFPQEVADGRGFDNLLLANVAALLEAAAK
jgi:ABC-type Zn uptake system ZnuABC Zn-binding protein ZnuA